MSNLDRALFKFTDLHPGRQPLTTDHQPIQKYIDPLVFHIKAHIRNEEVCLIKCEHKHEGTEQ